MWSSVAHVCSVLDMLCVQVYDCVSGVDERLTVLLQPWPGWPGARKCVSRHV